MSDPTPPPDEIDHAAAQPEPPAAHPAPPGTAYEPPAAQPRPAGGRWWNRRVPLLLTGAGLLLGCVLGAGVVAVGALAFGDGHGGGDRVNSHDRGDAGHGGPGRSGRGDGPEQPEPTTPATPSSPATPSAPATTAPSPTAS